MPVESIEDSFWSPKCLALSCLESGFSRSTSCRCDYNTTTNDQQLSTFRYRMLKLLHSVLAITGNLVLMVAFIIVAVCVQYYPFIYSAEIRISRDIFVPLVASTSVLFFLSTVSVLMLATRQAFFKVEVFAFMKSARARVLLSTLKIALTLLAIIVVTIPFMTPRLQTRLKALFFRATLYHHCFPLKRSL